MDARPEPRTRGRVLVAVGGVLAAGLAAGAGLLVRRRRAEDAELWAEAQRTDLPPVPAPAPVPPVRMGEPAHQDGPQGRDGSSSPTEPEVTDPLLETQPGPDSGPELELVTVAAAESANVEDQLRLPGELGPHDPSCGEVI